MTDQKLTVARLGQMRVKARNALQAEMLLSHLAIFQEPFGRSAIVGMAPRDMEKHTYIAAFATLRFRNIVKQMSSKRFYLEESIRILFPPTDAIRIQQLKFFIGCVSVNDTIWARLRWFDLSSALEWGLNHQPVLGFKLAQKIRHNMHFSSADERRMIMDAIYREALRMGDLEMQIFALRKLGKTR